MGGVVWKGWAVFFSSVLLTPLVIGLVPEIVPVMLLCLPIAFLLGTNEAVRQPIWNWRDR